MPKLVISEGGQQSVFELFDDEATIGRGAANEIQVVDSRASKQHAVVRRVGGRMKLVDLESKNGTRVNGEFRNQRWLENGDVVTIGDLTMTYDGSDVVAGAAVAARPAVTLSAAVQAAPAAAPVAPRPHATSRVGAGARAGGRRGRDEDYEDDERGRRAPPRRKDNSAAVAMLVGGGVLGAIALLFLMLSHSGAGQNARALQEAKRMAKSGPLEAAISFLERNSDPSRTDEYVSVKEQLDAWKKQVAGQADTDRDLEAAKVRRKIEDDVVEQWKNHQTDEQLGKRILEFVEKYNGTLACMELLNGTAKPYPKLRELMEKAKGGK